MALVPLADLGRYDALYVSPHADDAALSCACRLLGERARAQRVLVLVLFESEAGTTVAELLARGADVTLAGLGPAARRRPGAPFRSLGFERSGEDADAFEAVVRVLADVAARVRARQIYVPLAVGAHIDHRLAHEAALQVLVDEPGRNLFLYEERPEAFAPGAVRVRLGLVAARLPPGANDAAQRAGLVRYLLRVNAAPAARGDLRGFVDRFRSLGAAAGEWRATRAWNPQKAFGPRLQPVVHPAEAGVAPLAEELWASLVPTRRSRARASERFKNAALAYARKVAVGAGNDHAERYWLVLPSLPGAAEPGRREELEAAVIR